MSTTTTARTQVKGLQVATVLHQFIEEKVLPGTGVTSDAFWTGFDAIVADLAPRNVALLAERDRLQTEMDAWHKANPGPITDMPAYRAHLEKIGYLVESPKKAKINTFNVDAELAKQAGPQLVVPITNARYALNAANARWGSLYDALYGTDVISEEKGCEKVAEKNGKVIGYNPKRGKKVIEYARHVLDRTAPLKKGSHIGSTGYRVNKDGQLVVALKDGGTSKLKDNSQFIGFQGEPKAPTSVLVQHNGLHIDVIINRATPIGKTDAAGVSDLVVEAALSTILDLEDSVAVVDAADKVQAYGNWLGILQGTLVESFEKGGKTLTRGLNADRMYTAANGKGKVTLHGRSLMFVRNVGHLMTNPAILYTAKDGSTQEIPEGIMDAVVTTAIAMHDLKRTKKDAIRNSRKGSVYIVKPKMHGPAEVGFAAELFSRVEKVLGLPDSTVKLGIMDEERRTSVNLKACIAAASSRVAFINTGFLDRTGDEMHTAMHAGAMIRKGDMKTSAWIQAYEKNNVLVGLSCGLRGKAQIGKGMWAMPDLMKGMLEQKIAHPKAGANTPNSHSPAWKACCSRPAMTCAATWMPASTRNTSSACCSSSAPAICSISAGRRSRRKARRRVCRRADIALNLEDPDQYSGKYFYVPPRARWNDPWVDDAGNTQPALKHVKENVGSTLNKALEALEEENADALQDVLKGTINFNRKIGQNTLDDDTLVDFIQNFEKIPLRDEISSSPTCSAPPMNG
jgi:malate synthase